MTSKTNFKKKIQFVPKDQNNTLPHSKDNSSTLEGHEKKIGKSISQQQISQQKKSSESRHSNIRNQLQHVKEMKSEKNEIGEASKKMTESEQSTYHQDHLSEKPERQKNRNEKREKLDNRKRRDFQNNRYVNEKKYSHTEQRGKKYRQKREVNVEKENSDQGYQNKSKYYKQKNEERGFEQNIEKYSQEYENKLNRAEFSKLDIKPCGRKCWPQLSIYIMQTKLSMTFRYIMQHKADMLVIPYIDSKLNIYPGNIVNRCQIDYRKKIAAKEKELKIGSLYVQRCAGVDNFLTLAFLKIGQNNQQIEFCMKELLKKVLNLEIKIDTMVIPLVSQMGNPINIFKGVLEILEKGIKIKQVVFSTNKPEDFELGIQIFSAQINKFIKNNEVCIEY